MSPSWSDRGGRFAITLWPLLASAILRGATLVLPSATTPEEKLAADELERLWFVGTGIRAHVREEDPTEHPGDSPPVFFLGETGLARSLVPLPTSIDANGFRVRVLPGSRVLIRGATGAATELGVDWYAQREMGVRWFVPGPVGQVVPSLLNWSPPDLDQVVEPAFLSTEFSGLDGPGIEWARRNGLHATLPHAHAMRKLFPAGQFAEHPSWFPLLDGRRYKPAAPGDYDWQPNLARDEVAAHAAEEAGSYFRSEPGATAMSLSINDSIRFDQSADTIRARGPLRWFRGRPDYSDLVFGFMNRVSDRLDPRLRGKLLCADAYYWCEDAPSFPVRENIVPWLTADRSQWYDESFRQEDCDLMRRWCRSGARIVGIYDYLYGAPFLIPRATTHVTAQSIEFAHRAGVRAYVAEAYPNWGLDGPKLWVAAQLLWDPDKSVDALLDDYYSRFWGQAGPSMRRFDERCEKAWSGQAGPASWIRYYKDEAQVGLFPPRLCGQLRSEIEEARAHALSPDIRARVEIVSEAFSVTEAFSAFCVARTALSQAAESPDLDRSRADALIGDYRRKRSHFKAAYERAARDFAIGPTDIEPYLRDDPAAEVEAQLRPASQEPQAQQGLRDPNWATLSPPRVLDDLTFAWSTLDWFAKGEPVAGRTIEVNTNKAGRRIVSYRHCKSERLQQWVAAKPGQSYEARVEVSGRVSPGNQTYLILGWTDAQNHYVGRPAADRLPDGDWSRGKILVAAGTAPVGAAYAGVGIYVTNQIDADFASFSGLNLRVRRAPTEGPFSGN